MNRYLYIFIINISLLCLYITGCTVIGEKPVSSTVEIEITPSVTITGVVPAPTATETPQPTETFTPFSAKVVLPAVTMSPQEVKNALLELLKTNGNCTGKCIAGIRPDDMTVQEAVDKMAQWGMLSIGENSQGKTFINNLVQNSPSGQVNVALSVESWTKKLQTIDNVSFYIPSHSDGEFLEEDVWLANREAWQAFRLDSLLKAYGVPSYIGYFFQSTSDSEVPPDGRTITYSIEIQYEQLNLEVGIGARAYDNGESIFLCPSKDPHNLGIQINPERPLKELQGFRPVTWQALTGTDLDAFYQMFTNETNLDACVTTTLEQIQVLQPSFH